MLRQRLVEQLREEAVVAPTAVTVVVAAGAVVVTAAEAEAEAVVAAVTVVGRLTMRVVALHRTDPPDDLREFTAIQEDRTVTRALVDRDPPFVHLPHRLATGLTAAARLGTVHRPFGHVLLLNRRQLSTEI